MQRDYGKLSARTAEELEQDAQHAAIVARFDRLGRETQAAVLLRAARYVPHLPGREPAAPADWRSFPTWVIATGQAMAVPAVLMGEES